MSELIIVYASNEWILDDLNLESALFFPYLRSGNRKSKQQKYQRHYFFTYDIPKLSKIPKLV